MEGRHIPTAPVSHQTAVELHALVSTFTPLLCWTDIIILPQRGEGGREGGERKRGEEERECGRVGHRKANFRPSSTSNYLHHSVL